MKIVRSLSICTFLLWLAAAASALNPDRDIHQLAHRFWSEKDGYPGGSPIALVQTTDGFLWLGSDYGLFRFDGVHFERYVATSGDQLPEGAVSGLLALADGSLWIGYRGAISVLRNGNVKSYPKADGVSSTVGAIVQDHEGTMWAKTFAGILRFNGTRWERIGKDWNFPEEVPHDSSMALLVDSRGTLWVGVGETVLYLKQGSKRFEPTGASAGYPASFAEAPDGTIWMADLESYVRTISTPVSAKSAATAKCVVEWPAGTPPKCAPEDPLVVKFLYSFGLLFDRNGSLWMASQDYGVGRVPHPERLRGQSASKSSNALQTFTSKDGLSADSCLPILEDREGNIWVATRDGLDQFRDTALVPVPFPTSISRIAIAPADSGDIWASGNADKVARIHGDWRELSFIHADAYKLYEDPAGVTWLMEDALRQLKDGKARIVASSPDGLAGSDGYWQVVGDRFGTLWAFARGRGFFSLDLDHHRWKAWATPPEVARQYISDIFSDSTGKIWVSTFEGGIITMDKGNVMDYAVTPDRPIHLAYAFAERAPQQIWAAGTGGLVLIDRGQFRLIKPAGLDSFKDVEGIVDASSGGL